MDLSFYLSPVGRLALIGEGDHLIGTYFPGHPVPLVAQRETPVLRETRLQLDAYFSGKLQVFDLPLHLEGTPFQRKVWEELQHIPYGQVISYGELARRIGQPTAARAVGGANHNNPVSIIVPCHRVIAANGAIGGYGGGLECKRYLLDLEGVTFRT